MSNSSFIQDYLTASAQSFPDRIAAKIADGDEICYDELARRSDQVANYLQGTGFSSGDLVALLMPKSIEALISIYGILKAGGAYLPLPISAPEAALSIIDSFAASHILTNERTASALQKTASVTTPFTSVGVIQLGSRQVELFQKKQRPTEVRTQVSSDSSGPAVVLRTSGTTNHPKGVVHSHETVRRIVEFNSRMMSFNRDDRLGNVFPLFFGGSVYDLFMPACHAATLVMINDHFLDPARLTQIFSAHQITVCKSPAAVLSLVAQKSPTTSCVPSVRFLSSSGELFPTKHLSRLKILFPNAAIHNFFASTEVPGMMAKRMDATDLVANDPAVFDLATDFFGAELKVVDESENQILDRAGELWVSSPNLMVGYLDDFSRNMIQDSSGKRWFKTGDQAIHSSAGQIRLLGRKDRRVKRSGIRIELEEIETQLLNQPEILEAAVIALPDDTVGVRISAFYTTRDDVRLSTIQLKSQLARVLSIQFMPDFLVQLNQLPRSPNGKTDFAAMQVMATLNSR